MNTYEVRVVIVADSKEAAIQKVIKPQCELRNAFVRDMADHSGAETEFLLKEIFNG